MPATKKAKAAAPQKPVSYKQLINTALKNPDYAQRVFRLAKKAAAGDEAALAQLRQNFALSPGELKRLNITSAQAASLFESCTIPTVTHFLACLAFFPGRKKKAAAAK